jgi:hypothetical protein
MNIRTDSTEWIYGTMTADHDLAGVSISVALPSTGTAPSAWFPATVTEVDQIQPDRWVATYRVLVGPIGGAVTLTAGTYDWVFKLTDSPEVPIRKTGTVTAS